MDPSPSIARRRFVKLLAVSAASLAMAPDPARAAAAAAAPKRRRTTVAPPPAGAALEKELATERKSVADMLKVVRAYKLPAGSPPAMVFRPMKANRAASRGGRAS